MLENYQIPLYIDSNDNDCDNLMLEKTMIMITKLKLLMLAKGETVSSLSKKLGIYPSAVKNAVDRGIKSANGAKRYAAILDCQPQDLLEW